MVNFWDTSALASLFVREVDTELREVEFLNGGPIVVWWGTQLELRSALERRRREGGLSPAAYAAAIARMEVLKKQWHVVRPSDFCLERTERLLSLHPLRAADAFQLAAALLACGEHTKAGDFHCSDRRLWEAAEREGFRIFTGGRYRHL